MSQNLAILDYMKTHGSITPLEALNAFGCMRLGARIYDLRQAGIQIRCEMEAGINRFGYPTRFARYSIEGGNGNA